MSTGKGKVFNGQQPLRGAFTTIVCRVKLSATFRNGVFEKSLVHEFQIPYHIEWYFFFVRWNSPCLGKSFSNQNQIYYNSRATMKICLVFEVFSSRMFEKEALNWRILITWNWDLFLSSIWCKYTTFLLWVIYTLFWEITTLESTFLIY